MRVLRAAGHFAVPEGEPDQYREHARARDLSVGTYCIPVGSEDGRHPHGEDEVYVVVRGRARRVSATVDVEIGPGSGVHVPAAEERQFVDVSEDLSTVVGSGPAERARR